MKYIKSYNESNSGSGNSSFEWLNKQNNESYFELVDILQSKLFDDYNIISATDENFDDDDNKPEHYFWLYQVNGKLVAPKDLNGVIDAIFVYNISEEDRVGFFESLKGLETIVEDITGKQLFISEEVYVDEVEIYDYIIKLK